MKTIDEIIREHLPQCFLTVDGSYFRVEDEVKISPDLIRKLMTEYALEVQREQQNTDSIWGAALYYQQNHPSNSLVTKFRNDMIQSPLKQMNTNIYAHT